MGENMRYIKPEFFDTFSCTADKCPDTCCAGWQIMIDEDSLDRYAEVKGAFGKRLRNSIDWEEGAFYQNNRRCAFLNDQNLCDLYIALGGESLCDTCRKYPRHVEEYEGLREWSLSLSCPVAARMILEQKGFWSFSVLEDDEPDELEEEFEDFDILLFTQLEDARNVIFAGLKKEENNVSFGYVERNMNAALDLAEKMQSSLEEGSFFEIEDAIADYQVSDLCGTVKSYQESLDLYHQIYDLERLRPEWTDVLKEMELLLYESGEERYVQLKKKFETYIKADEERIYLWENTGLQLFTFFVFTYFCGAVYDDWIYSKMALAVHSVEFIRELFFSSWCKKGALTFEDMIQLSYRYAREIEHSDQNLNALEEIFAEEI